MNGVSNSTLRSSLEEWRQFWPLVLAAMAGFALHNVSAYSIGLFMEPLAAEFSWSRAQISVVSLIPAALMVVFSPATGALIDLKGSRRIAVPSVALTGVALASISFANGSTLQWYLLWTFYGAVSLGIKATVWTAAITRAFTASRGLALGVVLVGAAVPQVVVPPLAQWLIGEFGWRQAYVWLGIGWGAPAFFLALLFLFDAHDSKRSQDVPNSVHEPGLTFTDALRSVPLVRIGASTLITIFIGSAILIHQVPILSSLGLSRPEAAWLASFAGIAGIAGKLLTGWMFDRWNASWVASITLTVPAIAYLTLMTQSRSLAVTVCAMAIIGYTSGSKLQMCAYLTGRYCGMRNYGKIFGVMTSLIGIGGGLGSVAAGAIFDRYGNYEPLLMFGVAASFICGVLLFNLGRYPDWTGDTRQAKA